jgi:RimJ/RimL family protein N-acetyltransferase
MNIFDTKQPDVIYIDNELRLRRFGGDYRFALTWYQDIELVNLVDGPNAVLYTPEKLKKMYDCLTNQGEVYFIEILKNDRYFPIGDVGLSQENLPIVIGEKNYQGLGIGKKVVSKLISIAKELDFAYIKVEIFDYNIPSQKLFTSLGFKEFTNIKNGKKYILFL